MASRTGQQARALAAAFAPIPRPVDVTDAAAFPEIAAARQHLARKQERAS